jgi:hypothetical protein
MCMATICQSKASQTTWPTSSKHTRFRLVWTILTDSNVNCDTQHATIACVRNSTPLCSTTASTAATPLPTLHTSPPVLVLLLRCTSSHRDPLRHADANSNHIQNLRPGVSAEAPPDTKPTATWQPRPVAAGITTPPPASHDCDMLVHSLVIPAAVIHGYMLSPMNISRHP